MKTFIKTPLSLIVIGILFVGCGSSNDDENKNTPQTTMEQNETKDKIIDLSTKEEVKKPISDDSKSQEEKTQTTPIQTDKTNIGAVTPKPETTEEKTEIPKVEEEKTQTTPTQTDKTNIGAVTPKPKTTEEKTEIPKVEEEKKEEKTETTPIITYQPTNSTNDSEKNPVIEKTKVKGRVVDGQIYGAEVMIMSMDKKLLAKTTTDKNGEFNIDVPNLPDNYLIITNNGIDMGVDGEININDKKSFSMKAIAKKGELVNITPVSTVITEIEEQGKTLQEAQNDLNKAFNFNANTNLNNFNPIIHDKINKVGNFLALLANSIPANDKELVFKSIAKVLSKKKISVNITNQNVDIKSLNLADITDEVKLLSPKAILSNDISKILKVEKVIKLNLKKVTEEIQTVKNITQEGKIRVLAKKIAFDSTIAQIQKSDEYELNLDKLELFGNKMAISVEAVLKNNSLNNSSDDDIELFSEIVNENLNKDDGVLSTALVQIASDYKEVSKLTTNPNSKKIFRDIYKYSDIRDVAKIEMVTKSLKDVKVVEQIDDSANAIAKHIEGENAEIKVELQTQLENSVAGIIANEIDKSGKDVVKIAQIKNAIDNSVKNDFFTETIKKRVEVKISIKQKVKKDEKLSKMDKAKLIASNDMLKKLKISVKITKFTKIAQNNSDKIFDKINQNIENSDNDMELENKITALEFAFFDFSKPIDENIFEKTITDSVKIAKNINSNDDINRIESIIKIQNQLISDLKKDIHVDSIASISSNITDNVVIKKPKAKEMRLIQPPIISGGEQRPNLLIFYYD